MKLSFLSLCGLVTTPNNNNKNKTNKLRTETHNIKKRKQEKVNCKITETQGHRNNGDTKLPENKI